MESGWPYHITKFIGTHPPLIRSCQQGIAHIEHALLLLKRWSLRPLEVKPLDSFAIKMLKGFLYLIPYFRVVKLAFEILVRKIPAKSRPSPPISLSAFPLNSLPPQASMQLQNSVPLQEATRLQVQVDSAPLPLSEQSLPSSHLRTPLPAEPPSLALSDILSYTLDYIDPISLGYLAATCSSYQERGGFYSALASRLSLDIRGQESIVKTKMNILLAIFVADFENQRLKEIKPSILADEKTFLDLLSQYPADSDELLRLLVDMLHMPFDLDNQDILWKEKLLNFFAHFKIDPQTHSIYLKEALLTNKERVLKALSSYPKACWYMAKGTSAGKYHFYFKKLNGTTHLYENVNLNCAFSRRLVDTSSMINDTRFDQLFCKDSFNFKVANQI